jgi:hypothetical protein
MPKPKGWRGLEYIDDDYRNIAGNYDALVGLGPGFSTLGDIFSWSFYPHPESNQ